MATRLCFGLLLAGCNAEPATTHAGDGSGGDPIRHLHAGADAPPATPLPPPELAPLCDPPGAYAGAPLTAPPDEWTWVDVPEAKCRDGSSTGIGVRLHPGATKLVIYLEGGGACFHDQSCAINLGSFGSAAFGAWVTATGSAGIFDPSRTDNPFLGWSFVYVPYCTGDVHAGNAEHVDVPGNAPKDQFFVGYKNIGLYLQRIVPTFAGAEQVVLTGISAGGVGAAYNYDRVAKAFCGKRVTLVDDSGPVLTDQYLAPCLQTRWRQLWNLDATLPADCAACKGANGGGLVNYISYLTAKYPNQRLSAISANQDSVISLFFGYGTNDCAGLDGASAGMSGDTFEAGLYQLEYDYLEPSTNWGSYIVPSTSHTWTTALTFYTTTVSEIPLSQWVDGIVNHQTTVHVKP